MSVLARWIVMTFAWTVIVTVAVASWPLALFVGCAYGLFRYLHSRRFGTEAP